MSKTTETFQEFRKRFNAQLFDEYTVTARLKDIVGGTPAGREPLRDWINSTCKEMSDEGRKKLVEATIEELPELAEDVESRSWTRFKRDEAGPYIEGRQIKAALKEASNIIKTKLTPTKKRTSGDKKQGIANLKHKVAETVFVVEDKIYILRDGKRVTGEVPTEERAIHVMVRQGPRTALKRTDVLTDVDIRYTVRLAKTGEVTEEALFAAVAYLEELGYGADRSQGRGQARAPSDVEKK